jgi:hypothetical protein
MLLKICSQAFLSPGELLPSLGVRRL